MSSIRRRVALVAAGDDARAALADYLRRAGFDIHAFDALAIPSAFEALVMVSAPDTSSDALVRDVRAWIRSTRSQRIVVVTSKPIALKDLVIAHGERLFVLPAPVFGWELVDVLRKTVPPRPRGA